MSSFVTDILNKALETKATMLVNEYKDAESDPERIEVIEDWKDVE